MSKQETGVRRRPAPDRRISELDSLLRSLPAASLPSQLAGDALSTQQAHNNRLGRESLHLGVVVQAVPHYNWYKVQLGDGLGTIGDVRACRRSSAASRFDFLNEGIQSFFAACDDADRALAFRERLGDLPADATRRSGDDGDLIGE
jgi:hypothetical protein